MRLRLQVVNQLVATRTQQDQVVEP
jgi:hypothetical protein